MKQFGYFLIGLLLFISCKEGNRISKSDAAKDYFNDQVKEIPKDVTSQYFDKILEAEKFVSYENENLTLAPCDSLFSKDNLLQLYYFKVYTKWLKGTDGYVSEAAGLAALKYLEDEPARLARNFSASSLLSDADRKRWQQVIRREITIAHENKETEYFLSLLEKLGSKEYTNKERLFIGEFVKEIMEFTYTKQ